MKIASYLHQGVRSYGIVKTDGIIDLGSRLCHRYADLKSLLVAGELATARSYSEEKIDFTTQEIDYLPVIENPGKILCAGMNYAEKRQEFGQTDPAPTLFIRFADSQTGHNTRLLKPYDSDQFDYEGELAIIIGTAGRHISQADALSHIAGYSCYMDASVRDWQHAWFTAGKNWRNTGGFGPYLTTSDEIDNPHNLMLRTRLNGTIVQQDNTCNMIHSIPYLIEYISTFTRISAGDVIITGSPGGTGKMRRPPLFMQPGDRIEVDIEQVGHLINTVAEEPVVSEVFTGQRSI
ncbi:MULTISPECIES: fumarylacetoacetate hydrolase family protein [unclassified Tatumella]|uniref:fumarylacetoacetate hydrolase family protein n=1 Tax=unclassified Tatumella TaxID=2649542 RepID=UPI001BB00228|nr:MULTISPECIES: fumarylacetoacetate hydrolase family protein [unclassified Tatumella]MBS0877035.1 fumarylacetoacetate hydrolase family protein [Tatumella sp. JGM82]MBS0890697.1 fumarylacetoacetate hydrolase family protein [Tatumella sp. JGM94]MBS0901338.1 fumarylacetoacetate hydrolase family protein [Tatumella sp. JGM100]